MKTESMLFILCCLLLLPSTALSSPPEVTARADKAPPLSQTVSRGEYKLTRRIDHASITTAGRLRLELSVEAPEEVQTAFPVFDKTLGDFDLLSTESQPPRLINKNRKEETRVYTLQPFLPGTYEVPALEVEFIDETGQTTRMTSDRYQVKVTSLLGDNPETATPSDINGPVAQPLDLRLIGALALLALLTVALLVWLFIYLRRRRLNRPPPPPPSPREIAEGELALLLSARLADQGLVKEFHHRLSLILRHYLENRFGLRAPEQTTEEFLAELGSGPTRFGREFNDNLRRFLVSCDLVKFALRQPTSQEIEQAVNSCRRIIELEDPHGTGGKK